MLDKGITRYPIAGTSPGEVAEQDEELLSNFGKESSPLEEAGREQPFLDPVAEIMARMNRLHT